MNIDDESRYYSYPGSIAEPKLAVKEAEIEHEDRES